MIDIKHHHRDVFILIVGLRALVEELRLHLDQAVERLVGDESSVASVQLHQQSRVSPEHKIIRQILFLIVSNLLITASYCPVLEQASVRSMN